MKKSFLTILGLAIFAFAFGQRDYSAKPNCVYKTNASQVIEQDVAPAKASLFESFETAVPPADWTKQNPDGGSGWAQIADGTSPLPGWQGGTMTVPEGGGGFAAYCTWSTGGSSSNDQWLITPAMDVSDGDALTFWMLYPVNNFSDNFEVLLSTTDNQTASFTETIASFTLNSSTSTEWTEYTYDLSAYDGQTVYIAFREHEADNQNNGGFVALDLIEIGTLPEVEAALTAINIPSYVQVGNSIDVAGTIINNGSNNITSFDVTYEIEGNTSTTYSVTGVDIALGGTYNFTHDAAYTFNNTGVIDVEVTVSNVNGGGEANLGDNTLTRSITAYSNSVQRKVVLENFTTGQCPNCPPVHTLLEDYVEAESNAILIAQHAGFYTDEMTIPENTELLALYGGPAYAPGLCIDRYYYTEGLTGGAADPGPVFFPGASGSATTTRIDNRIDIPAFISVNVDGSYSSDEISIDVTGEIVSDIAGDDIRLAVYVTEDGLIYNQAGGSSSYEHNNVMRDAISETWGDAGVITANTSGTTFTKNYTFSPDNSWDLENLYVVVFVANYDDADVKNREILNAERVKVTDLEPVSIQNISKSNIEIYPNPASDFIKISNVANSTLEIYNVVGELVYTQNTEEGEANINTANLTQGNYIVKVKLADETVVTEKITIVR